MILKSKNNKNYIWDVSDKNINKEFRNIHLLNNSDKYIIKIASIDDGPLFCEMHFYIKYCRNDNIDDYNILKYIDSGTDTKLNIRYLVLPKLDYNIEQVNFSINNILLLSKDILKAIEFIHNNNYIHGDIKPLNILYDYKKNKYYLSDFGNVTKHTTDFKPNKKICNNGTYQYMSVDMHKGIASFKSDLESFGYTLYNLIYDLPWDNNKNNKIIKIKSKFINDTIDSNNILSDYFNYVNNIKEDKNIDYKHLLSII